MFHFMIQFIHQCVQLEFLWSITCPDTWSDSSRNFVLSVCKYLIPELDTFLSQQRKTVQGHNLIQLDPQESHQAPTLFSFFFFELVAIQMGQALLLTNKLEFPTPNHNRYETNITSGLSYLFFYFLFKSLTIWSWLGFTPGTYLYKIFLELELQASEDGSPKTMR